MARIFSDRREAGRFLAGKLAEYRGRSDLIVFGLPRGGVPVAYEVAMALEAPLDVFVVRKIGAPDQPELGMGAIASGGVRVLNRGVIDALGIARRQIEAVAAEEQGELERREREYRDNRPFPQVAGQIAILVDDGLATGSTMRAAVAALRQHGPGKIIVAVPTSAAETCEQLRGQADEVVCATTPEPFVAVGAWYEDFSQTSDDEVRRLLASAADRFVDAAERG